MIVSERVVYDIRWFGWAASLIELRIDPRLL